MIPCQKMLKITLWLFMGVFVWDSVSCSVICPDGNKCSDGTTCCFQTHGYGCCPYPKAVCCPDLLTCCPSGYRCNMVSKRCVKENQPWLSIPLVKKHAAERPNPPVVPDSSVMELKNSRSPDEQNGQCCADGKHCCEPGYKCDALSMTCWRFYSQVPSGAQEEAQAD